MRAFLITAMQSGAGKTVMSCALMAALKQKGLTVNAFKSGPDYIDPMFHRRVLEEGVRRSFRKTSGDVEIVEDAMGYYDGLNGGTEASAWDLACRLNLPAVLVLRPKGSGLTLAAQVRGIQTFRQDSRICALLLADCSERLAGYLLPVLERECGLPVLGYMPHMSEAELESRHLGLLTEEEIEDFTARMDRLAEQISRTADLERLISLAAEGPSDKGAAAEAAANSEPVCRIAVARDEAFCFQYADNLYALRSAGAELLYFSPLRDCGLPEADGLYLCGGYPELFAGQLAANESMRTDIAKKVRSGLPTVAECGGFLYLQQSLEDAEGRPQPMCGVLPGRGFRTGHLQRFGYLTLSAERDSMLLRRGERLPAHEFHYWDSTENGSDLRAEKTDGRSWGCGCADRTVYAAFPHLHFGGELPLAERFAEACVKYRKHEED